MQFSRKAHEFLTDPVRRFLFVVRMAVSVFEIYRAEDRTREVIVHAGEGADAIAGGWAGAKDGTAGGAGVGAFFFGGGAAPGALIWGIGGGLEGGALDFWGGSSLGASIYNWHFSPLTKEEWGICDKQ